MSEEEFDEDQLFEDLEDLDENSPKEDYIRLAYQVGRHTEMGAELRRNEKGEFFMVTDLIVNLSETFKDWFGQ